MRIPRLYVEASLTPGDKLPLPETAFRHCVQVLRLGEGARVVLFNGNGRDYTAALERVGRREASAAIISARENLTESPLELCLVQGISKADHMDLTIQKAVELGVRCICPVICARSQRIPRDRIPRRHAHWLAIAVSACEQSGRSRLPALMSPIELDEWLADIGTPKQRLMLDPRADAGLSDITLDAAGTLEVLIGPEGGFADDELTRVTAAGVVAARMGPRVLRTETAAIAALTLIQARWGDLR